MGTTNINSVSLLVCPFVCWGLETQITFNKIVPPNSRAQKLFKTSSSYFLFLLLRLFPRNNCHRRWRRYFWDLEGGWGDLGAHGPGGVNGLKNPSGKCEGRGGGVDGVKNRSGQWEGPGEGKLNGCIMHQVHISLL
jgi:hypothetical protein